MPEGDTILRAARTLAKVLAGRTVVRFASRKRFDRKVEGRVITAVDAHGKNLFIRFDDGRALHTHMQMTGSWHVYRPGERWQKSEGAARVVIEVGPHGTDQGWVAVCFAAPVVEMLLPGAESRTPRLMALGPDILAPDFDRDEALRRLRTLDDLAIGEAILEQRAVAGIGNIYKSETLFAVRVDPFASVKRLDDATLDRVLSTARRLMSSNLTGTMRTTATGPSRYWVYRRLGLGCLECSTAIEMSRQGKKLPRSTYYCPRCQHVRAVSAPSGT